MVPKIIDSIEDKIFAAAFKLFAEKGYDSVSMKIVAEEVGIAVGTLYNYHSNKQQLFLTVLKKNIKQTYFILNDIIEKDDGDTHEFVSALYDETLRIRKFIEEIIKNSKRHEIFKLKEDLLKVMRDLIDKIKEKKNLKISEKTEERIIRLLLLTIIDFAKEFPEEREENINFISNTINTITS